MTQKADIKVFNVTNVIFNKLFFNNFFNIHAKVFLIRTTKKKKEEFCETFQ